MRRSIRPLAAAGIALAGTIALHSTADAVVDPNATIFLSEIHYNDPSPNAGDRVEITGPATTDLNGWTIWLYDGATGSNYGNGGIPIADVVPGAAGELGAVLVNPPGGGLQEGDDGAPDGVALVDPSDNVVQFLSYGGAFAALGGPADGLTSTDIGITEPVSSSESLQLVNVGPGYAVYGDFEWQGPLPQTFGTPPADNTTPPPNGDPSGAVGEFTLVDAPGPCIIITAGATVSFPDLTIGSGDASPGDVDTVIDSCSTNDTDPQSVTQAISSAFGATNNDELTPTLCPTVPLQFILPGASPSFDCGAPPTAGEFGYGGFASTDATNWQSVVDASELFTSLTVEPLGSTTVSHAVVGPDLGAVADTYQFDLTYTAFFG